MAIELIYNGKSYVPAVICDNCKERVTGDGTVLHHLGVRGSSAHSVSYFTLCKGKCEVELMKTIDAFMAKSGNRVLLSRIDLAKFLGLLP